VTTTVLERPSAAVPALPRQPARHRKSRGFLRTTAWVIAAALVGWVALPQVTGAGAAWGQLSGLEMPWLWAAVALEAASLAAYAALTRALIPRAGRPGYARLLGIDLATLAASHVVPAGSAVGLGLGYRLLTAAGVRGPTAVSAKAVQAVGSAVVLNVLLWVALVVSVAQHGTGSGYGIVAALGVVLMAGVAVLLGLLLRAGDRAGDAMARALGRLPRVSEPAVRGGVAAVVDHLRQLTADRRLLTAATAWAAVNWLLDAAALWACVRASGTALGVDGTFVAYGIAAVVAAMPITPGGLGVVEASLIPSLIAAGAPQGAAVLGVLAWRALTFLLPIPVGGMSFAMLERRPGTPSAVRGCLGKTAPGRFRRRPRALPSNAWTRQRLRAARRRLPTILDCEPLTTNERRPSASCRTRWPEACSPTRRATSG
jgi:uncharacterized protein (TIRG00374 family)